MLFISLSDSCCDQSSKVTSHEESSVYFSCLYKSEDQNSLKYICRGKQTSTCRQQAVITSDDTQKGQFRFTDDKKSKKFTVTITNVTQKDSGPYLCGVHRNVGLDVFSAVELEVKGEMPLLFKVIQISQTTVFWCNIYRRKTNQRILKQSFDFTL